MPIFDGRLTLPARGLLLKTEFKECMSVRNRHFKIEPHRKSCRLRSPAASRFRNLPAHRNGSKYPRIKAVRIQDDVIRLKLLDVRPPVQTNSSATPLDELIDLALRKSKLVDEAGKATTGL